MSDDAASKADVDKLEDTVSKMSIRSVETNAKVDATNVAINTTNDSISRLDKKFDSYITSQDERAKLHESQTAMIKSDVGNRHPDHPDLCSQVQSLNSFKKETITTKNRIWTVIVGAITSAIVAIGAFFWRGTPQ